MAGRVQFDAAAASPSKVEEDDIEAKFRTYAVAARLSA